MVDFLNILDFIYNVELRGFSPNSCFFLVAVSALLVNLHSVGLSVRASIESSKSTFIAYKLVFATILFESLALVICLDGFKIQMGIMVWIIYMSALMILFLVFLTLTLDEFLYKSNQITDSDTNKIISESESASKFNFYFLSSLIFFFIIFFILISSDFILIIKETELLNSITYNNNTLLGNSNTFAYSDIMYTIAKDISSSHMEYLLSGLLQGVCLISVISLIIFK